MFIYLNLYITIYYSLIISNQYIMIVIMAFCNCRYISYNIHIVLVDVVYLLYEWDIT